MALLAALFALPLPSRAEDAPGFVVPAEAPAELSFGTTTAPAAPIADAAPADGPDAAADVKTEAARTEPAADPAAEPAANPAAVPAPAVAAAPGRQEPAPATAASEPSAPVVAQPAAEAPPRPDPAAPAVAAVDPVVAPLRALIEAPAEPAAGRAVPGRTPAAQLRREREAVAAFYAARDFAPVWIADGGWSPRAQSALARLERAREDGLDIGQYAIPTPSGDAASRAAADVALSQAVVGYAAQASGGRIDPRAISGLITARPPVADGVEALTAVSTAADAGDALRAFNPPHAGYVALREKLDELRRAAPPTAGSRIGPGPALKVGMKDARTPLVRARFGIDANADAHSDELVYDTRVASAVADFQRAHGLPANGVLTARTIAALSGGQPARLEAEIVANMERWRWLPRDLGATRIEVNIPDYQVRLTRDGEEVLRARVIVGKPETQTPVFSDEMQYLVVNPYWNVPPSIIRKEMLPAFQKDPTYFSRRGYEVVQRKGGITVRQPPGERNALGNIKFMFPNDHSVYLHDTPNRKLFGADRRAFSHGCVRVDQPFRLAEALLPADWTEQRLRRMVGGGAERTVRLPERIPIHLQYFTASVDEQGKMRLRDDIYGHSRKVQAALGY